MDAATNPLPSLTLIQEHEDALLRAATLRAALELGLFDLLAEGSRGVADIVARTGYDERGVQTILDALCPMGFVTKSGDLYDLTPTSNTLLVSYSRSYYGRSCLQTTLSWAATGSITESVRTGKALASHVAEHDVGQLWAADVAPYLAIWPQRAETAREMWRTLRGRYNDHQDLRILDVGCGDGTKTFVLAESRPAALVTAMDLHEEVLNVAARVAEAMGVHAQTRFRVGDILTADWGEEDFDITFFGALLYFFNHQQLGEIFCRAFKALRCDGLIVINHVMADEARCSAAAALLLAVQLFIFHPTAHVYTFSEYQELLAQAGFVDMVRHNDSLMSARKKS
jgi:2-polyprenyl-3-methyl-5-hydroxy-6-metoxy-1,4-benzoquinol methylase